MSISISISNSISISFFHFLALSQSTCNFLTSKSQFKCSRFQIELLWPHFLYSPFPSPPPLPRQLNACVPVSLTHSALLLRIPHYWLSCHQNVLVGHHDTNTDSWALPQVNWVKPLGVELRDLRLHKFLGLFCHRMHLENWREMVESSATAQSQRRLNVLLIPETIENLSHPSSAE